MSVRTIRARVHAGRFEPLEDISVPEGTEVSVLIDEPEIGTAQALVAAARQPPHLQPGDIEALEEAIEAGKLPVRDEGIFDEPKA